MFLELLDCLISFKAVKVQQSKITSLDFQHNFNYVYYCDNLLM